MANSVWQGTVQDASGNIVTGAEISVYDEVTGTLATIYSDIGGTALTNPFFSDSNGFAQFYATAGQYRITAVESGSGLSQTFRHVRLGEAGSVDTGTASDEVPLNSDLRAMKNLIINGDFSINQRGVSGTVTLSAGEYGHDRFKAGSGGCTYTFNRSGGVTTLTISSGTLLQIIETDSMPSLDVVLSWSGTAQGRINGGAYGGSGITGATIGGSNTTVEFNTGTVSLAQLERGLVVTDFDFEPPSLQLQKCQRYYEKSYNQDDKPGAITDSASFIYEGSGEASPVVQVQYAQKIVTPVIEIYSPTTGAAMKMWNDDAASDVSALAYNTGETGTGVFTPTTPGAGHDLRFHWVADAEL
jgi:hypothetical protein